MRELHNIISFGWVMGEPILIYICVILNVLCVLLRKRFYEGPNDLSDRRGHSRANNIRVQIFLKERSSNGVT